MVKVIQKHQDQQLPLLEIVQKFYCAIFAFVDTYQNLLRIKSMLQFENEAIYSNPKDAFDICLNDPNSSCE